MVISSIFPASDQTAPLHEDDKPKPIGTYATSKYEAEKFIIINSKKFLICRAGWMMGGGPKKDKKFIQKIIKQIKDGKRTLYK